MPERFNPEDFQIEDGRGRQPVVVNAEIAAQKAKAKKDRQAWTPKRQAEAAVRTENIVGSTFNAMNWQEQREAIRREHGATPDYDVVEDLWDEDEWRPRLHLFRGSRSPQETELIKRRYLLEKEDKKVLDDSGFSGEVFKLGAGVLDISSVPGVGPTLRGVKGARVIAGFGEEALMATGQELLLTSTQTQRDGQPASILLSTVVGGSLKSLDTPEPPAKWSDEDLLTRVETPQSMALRETARGARIADGEGRPASGEAVKAMAGADGTEAVNAGLRAISGDLALQARDPKVAPLVKRQSEASLRQMGADEEGGLSDAALSSLRADLERLKSAGDDFPAGRRAALERVSVSLRGLRRALAERGAAVGAGGRAATDALLTPGDRLAIAFSDIWPGSRMAPETLPTDRAASRSEPSPLIVPGADRWPENLETPENPAARLAADDLPPALAEVATIDEALRDAAGPEAMARMEEARGRLIDGLTPPGAKANSPAEGLAQLRRIVSDPALGALAEAANWRVAEGGFGRSLAERLPQLSDDFSRLGMSPREAALAGWALDDDLAEFGVSLRGASLGGPERWRFDPETLVGRVVDMRLSQAILDTARNMPLAQAQARRLAALGLDDERIERLAGLIKRLGAADVAAGRPVRAGTRAWDDPDLAQLMDRIVTTETRSALAGGEAARVWKTEKLTRLVGAAAAAARAVSGEWIRSRAREPSHGLIGALTVNIVKGLLSNLLEQRSDGADEAAPEQTKRSRPVDGADLLGLGLARSGVTGWLFDAQPPITPSVAASGLDSPTGRMVRNLTALLLAIDGAPQRPAAFAPTPGEAADGDDGLDQPPGVFLHRASFVETGEDHDSGTEGEWSYFAPPDWRDGGQVAGPVIRLGPVDRLTLRPGGFGGSVRQPENPNLGGLSAVRESIDDPGAVSPASDPGGRSYGLYQFNTRDGIAEDFLKHEGKAFAARFGPGPNSASDAFKATWQAIALEDPDAFSRAQFAYARRIYYEPAVARLKADTGFDAADGHWTVQDVLWSTWVHHGVRSRSKILTQALAASRFKARMMAPDRLKTRDQNSYELERDFITAIYDARIGQVPAQSSLPDQLREERDRALAMLREEYDGRASF